MDMQSYHDLVDIEKAQREFANKHLKVSTLAKEKLAEFAQGELTLSEDEIELLKAYRQFRIKAKYSDIFKWRTHGKKDLLDRQAVTA